MVKDIACILAVSSRSLIYMQGLVYEDLIPAKCLILANDDADIYKTFHTNSDGDKYSYVDLAMSIGTFLDVNKIDYTILYTDDINSSSALNQIKNIPQKYIIYSGYGGCILKQPLFQIGKKWLHIHAGKLPEYRGSTTAYYSILDNNTVSATAIFLNEKIDEGNIICSESFALPAEDVNIDYLFEPYIRSQVLISAIKQYVDNGKFSDNLQNMEKAETYYIIHPVLKHIALLKNRQK